MQQRSDAGRASLGLTSDVFFSGGGEMGERMRALDWSKTALGPVSEWPQSLRSALSICLGAGFQIAIYWGQDLTLLYNDSWSPILGRKHPDALGRAGREVWPEIWGTIGPMFQHVLESGEATRSRDSLLAMHRHGFTEECYFDYTFSPIRDEAGRVGGIFNAVVETTFRVIGERRSRLLRELSDALVDVQSPQRACDLAAEVFAQASLDLPFSLLYLGSARTGAQLTATAGVSPEDASLIDRALGISGRSSGTTPEHPVLISNLSERLGTPHVCGPWPEPCEQVFTIPLAIEGGGYMAACVSPRLAFDAGYREYMERIAGLLSAAITRARVLEYERQRVEALAQIDRAKTDFFSNVSHEFRTPLTLMLGPLESTLANPLPESVREPLKLAHRNALRLLKLVNSLLDFSRIEAGRAQASYAPTDLASLTRELASNFRSAMERAGLEYEVECRPLGEPVYVDRDLWEKIVLNLLSNAFKFTLKGRVTVQLREDRGSAMLSVSDTGVGISKEELGHVFERFHRIQTPGARTQEGSGIGLALVSELVKLHGGEISVQSEPGRGSGFSVRIPIGSAHLPKERVQEAAKTLDRTGGEAFVEEALRWLPVEATADPITIAHSATHPRAIATAGATIILADDNADMREYVRGLLSPYYSVVAVADGNAVLTEARRRHPDLVLSDVMMPGLDGFELLKALRNDLKLADIPVILLSARAGEEATIDGLSAGANDYLVKPFSARELLSRVDAQIHIARIRAQATTDLKASDARNRALVAASSDVVYRMNGDWTELRRLEGRAFIADTFEPSHTWLDRYIHPDDQKLVRSRIEHAIRNAIPFELEHRVLRVDGTLGWTFSRAVPILNDRGEITEWFGMASDISARKELERSLREADRRKDEFLATLAHELRNPLAPIRQAARIASLPQVTEAQRQWANDIINRQTQHMAMLLDDLLDLSRITRGKLDIRKAEVELSPIVDTAIETARPLIDARNHTLEVRLPREPVRLCVDALRIAQALSNLLTNAAKYTDPGGRLELVAEESANELVLKVKDNGIGIAREKLATVFDMFSQVQAPIDRSEGGLGIGLALVKGVAELHGGTVRVSSAGLGSGSEFCVTLPLARRSLDGYSQSSDNRKAISGIALRKVLIVDDHRDAAETLGALLAADGHEVKMAFDPLEGLDIARAFIPDVALLDLGMPRMNGFELARKIRDHVSSHRIHLVAVTGWGQSDDRRRAADAGFDDHLTKPVDLDALREVIDRTF